MNIFHRKHSHIKMNTTYSLNLSQSIARVSITFAIGPVNTAEVPLGSALSHNVRKPAFSSIFQGNPRNKVNPGGRWIFHQPSEKLHRRPQDHQLLPWHHHHRHLARNQGGKGSWKVLLGKLRTTGSEQQTVVDGCVSSFSPLEGQTDINRGGYNLIKFFALHYTLCCWRIQNFALDI